MNKGLICPFILSRDKNIINIPLADWPKAPSVLNYKMILRENKG
jgi:hypothetical protein